MFGHQNSQAANAVIEEKEAEGLKCRQKQESLSAQLQVIFEHKSRMEKSLKREKDERAAENEKCQQDIADKSAERRKGTSDCEVKLKESADKQQLSDDKLAELQKNYAALQQQMNELKDEKLKDEMKHDEELMKARGDVTQVETQFKNLAKEVESLRRENAELKETLTQCQTAVISKRSDPLKATNDRLAPQVPNELEQKLVERKRSSDGLTVAGAFGSLTTSTNRSVSAEKEVAEGKAQMPLPNDEKSIRKSQAHMADTGREVEVAQAEQVAVPKILNRPERASAAELSGNSSSTSSTDGIFTSSSTLKPLPGGRQNDDDNNDANVDQVAPPVLKQEKMADQPEDNKLVNRGGELEKPDEIGNKPDDNEEENQRNLDKDGYDIPDTK